MGKPWTDEEDVLLQQLLVTDVPYSEISSRLQRSKQSVITRYYKKFTNLCSRERPRQKKSSRDFSKGQPIGVGIQIEGDMLAEAKRRHGVHLIEKQGCYFLHGVLINCHDVILTSGQPYLEIYERVRSI